jgi:hypothetical protein
MVVDAEQDAASVVDHVEGGPPHANNQGVVTHPKYGTPKEVLDIA